MTTVQEAVLNRIMDQIAAAPETGTHREQALMARAHLLASLHVAGITGVHALTYRWFNAYRLGIESAQKDGTREIVSVFGANAVPIAAKRFAEMFSLDVPSAWMLGFKDEFERTLRRHQCY